MKKKAILTVSLAFALMASSLGSMNVSAEEGADVSVQAQERTGVSEQASLGQLKDVQFSEDLGWCTFSFPTKYYGPYRAHIWVYRDGELVKEYDTSRDNSNPWNFYVEQEECGNDMKVQTPFYQDLEDSGSYKFEVRMEKYLPWGDEVSEKVASNTVQYTRPEQALGTTTGYWDTETKGLFHYTSVEGAAGYEYRLYKQDGSQWSPCIFDSKDGVTLYTSIGHCSAFSRITAESSRDVGGEERTIDFTKEISSGSYNGGAGSYCVTVKALSGNLNEIANGAEGEMSDILLIENDSASGQDNNSGSGQADTPSRLETLIGSAQSGDVIQMQDVTALASSEVRQLLDRGLTLEMEYTYEGIDYKVCIPAGAFMDDSIPWYGPLYLAQHYGVGSFGGASASEGLSYIVKKGDTLSKIAHANGMTVSELAAKNPQIKNLNKIISGQIINIK